MVTEPAEPYLHIFQVRYDQVGNEPARAMRRRRPHGDAAADETHEKSHRSEVRHIASVRRDVPRGLASNSAAERDRIDRLDVWLRDLLRHLTPTIEERDARIHVLARVSAIARRCRLEVGVYGSLKTGVVLPDSDLDICVGKTLATKLEEPAIQRAPQPRRSGYSNPDFVSLLKELRRSGRFDNVIPIAHARVPIIKLTDREFRIDVDISFTVDGLMTSQYLVEELNNRRLELARPLIVLVKLMLRRWNLHEPKDGGLGSFVVSLMVLWYLTIVDKGHWTLPPESRAAVVSMSNRPGSLARLLVGFLTYFGEQFPFKTTGIDLRQGASFEKPNASELHFINPTLPGHNVACAATKFGVSVRPRFQSAVRVLCGSNRKGKEHSELETRLTPRHTAESAGASVFGDFEGDEAEWNRWSKSDYDSFKHVQKGEGVLFHNVLLPTPISRPQKAKPPPELAI
jgi:DNA polymerase sigma